MASSDSSILVCDVVVVGGGISGLCCARKLQENGINTILIEARKRVGGRLKTVDVDIPTKTGKVRISTDVGGAYIGPTQKRLLDLAEEFGAEMKNVPVKGGVKLHFHGRNLYTADRTKLENAMPIFMTLDVNHLMRTVQKECRSINMKEPWKSPGAKKWDSMTIEHWLQSMKCDAMAADFFRQVIITVLCAESYEVSMLYFLWYCKQGNGIKHLIEVEDGAQEKKFVKGTRIIYEGVYERLDKSKVILDAPVTSISQDDDGVCVHTKKVNVEAKYAVLAMAPPLIDRINISPNLSSRRMQLNRHYPMGSIIKTFMYYEKEWWAEKDLLGESFGDSNAGPIVYCIPDTKRNGDAPCLMGFICASRSRAWSDKSKEERQKAICEQYVKVFGIEEMRNPVFYLENDWSKEEFSGGCYVASAPPGALTEYGETLRQPEGRIHFAGTETGFPWTGYMDGGIQAGERAAIEVANKLGREIPDPETRDLGDSWVERLPLIERLAPNTRQIRILGLVLILVGLYFSQNFFGESIFSKTMPSKVEL